MAVAKYNSSQVLILNHQNEAKDCILTKRQEHAIGICAVLKGKHVVLTEELFEQ